MRVAVGILAYNEEANIVSAIEAVRTQKGRHLDDVGIWVVASGCTDATVPRAREASRDDARITVLEETRREGKAAAIGTLLDAARDRDVVVLANGDTRPEPGALEALVCPFDDDAVGMTGGRPCPVNDQATAMGGVVHLLWNLHHRVACRTPKLGEMVAFRPVFGEMPRNTAVDEASIEAMIRETGLRLVYVPEARVRMKGPTTVTDYLAQRRRIHAGHLRLRRSSGHAASTMSLRHIGRAVADVAPRSPRQFRDLFLAVTLEAIARGLGAWDARPGGRDHQVWKAIPTTKDLSR